MLNLRRVCFVLFCFLIANVGLAAAQHESAPVVARHLVGPLHILKCNDNAQVLASIGEDGTLLVDTGYPQTADAVRKELTELGSDSVDFIVNTHSDLDHVGGNAVLGKDAVVLAHPVTRLRMSTYFALPEIPGEGIPNLTVAGDATLQFNEDVIRILPFPGGHTGGDLVVHFTRAGVAFLGDIVLSETFPNSDPAKGGNASRTAEIIAELIETMPQDTVFVVAHGKSLTKSGLGEYLEMVEGTVAAVKKVVDAGNDLEATLKARPVAPWSKWENAEVGLTVDRWTYEVYAGLSDAANVSICAPLTETLVADGIDAAEKLYRHLKASEADAWDFGEGQLNFLGYQLLMRSMVDEAIKVFELNVESYPESSNPYDSLGEAYMAVGKNDLAIVNYERSLELDSHNDNAVAMLKKLRGN
ncbi:MAG: MBL fold metallo-hydrolase [bacterium]|nr:MBL fold metallo-hydrolase [bacterium]